MEVVHHKPFHWYFFNLKQNIYCDDKPTDQLDHIIGYPYCNRNPQSKREHSVNSTKWFRTLQVFPLSINSASTAGGYQCVSYLLIRHRILAWLNRFCCCYSACFNLKDQLRLQRNSKSIKKCQPMSVAQVDPYQICLLIFNHWFKIGNVVVLVSCKGFAGKVIISYTGQLEDRCFY